MSLPAPQLRKIIHVDMDCFYAAIEIRDNPRLANLPVAVGGAQDQRGVLCTCNYIARQYGVRSAMPTAFALKLCKDLIVIPPNMTKYKTVAANLQKIFKDYTPLVEPLALDEAYLDVTQVTACKGSATLIAQEIRNRIWEMEKLTASAGVAPNKFLAKIASGWKKPNGLFVIRPNDVEEFIKHLPIEELYGVGKVMAKKLHDLGLKTCSDLQKISLAQLLNIFGKHGESLYQQCRGIDKRTVEAHRERKSISVEHTFAQDINDRAMCLAALKLLYEKLMVRIEESAPNKHIKNQFIKIKFNNFRLISAEKISQAVDFEIFKQLFFEAIQKDKHSIRLIGVGVHFSEQNESSFYQHSF